MLPRSAKNKGKNPRKPVSSYSESYKEKLSILERRKRGTKKCRRCKKEFTVYDKSSSICKVCKTRCSSCGCQLTHENISNPNVKNRKFYRCKGCVAKGVRETTKPENQKDYDLRRNYGITYKEYKELLVFQNYTCAICGKENGTGKSLHVDHKHLVNEKKIRDEKGQALIRNNVRGLLCWPCNSAIAKFKDNPELMKKAADYITSPPAKQILK